MRHISTAALAASAILALGTSQLSAEPRNYQLPEGVITFRPGAGQDIAESNCLACHSSDYISTQPPGRGKTFWQAEVTRMRKAFGAHISDDDAKTIAEYLSNNY